MMTIAVDGRNLMSDLISRQAAIDCEYQVKIINDIEYVMLSEVQMKMRKLPPAQPEQHEIGYSECANAMLKMWIDNVLTDGEYSRIMDKLNTHWAERRKE